MSNGDGATVACWSCGNDNPPDRDFCEHCGEYLSWAPTGYVQAVGGQGQHEAEGDAETTAVAPAPPELAPPPLPGVPELPPATGDASLRIDPADPGSIGTAAVPAVETGSSTAFVATIRNESRIVDNYELSVAGLPDGWAVISPASVYLVPLGAGGVSEQDVRVDIAPPRLSTSTAGIWTFELVARSRTTGQVAARAAAQFEVRPFPAWAVEVTPVHRSGRLKARYRVAVRNDGNAVSDLWLVAVDEAERLRTSFASGKLALHPGEVGVDELTLRPGWPRPVGPKVDHRVGVDALPAPPDAEDQDDGPDVKGRARDQLKKAGGGVDVSGKGVKLKLPRLPKLRAPNVKVDAATLSKLKGDRSAGEVALAGRPVVFRQKPLIPTWLIVLLLVLAAIAAAVYLLLPRKTDVPNLIGTRDAFTADKRLRDEGLVLAQPIQRRIDRNAPPGSVISQSPQPGSRVEEGESVAIEVAAGTARVGVPRLTGLTRTRADERLRELELSLGDAQPADAPDSWVVRSQIPRAGLSVARGTPVRVFLKKPAAKRKPGDGGDGGPGGGGAGGKGKPVTIPAVDGASATEYAAKLDELKLEPKVTRVVAAVPRDKVIAVDPEPGTEAKTGDEVTVRASAGSPLIAYETEGLVQLFDPVSEKESGQLPEGDGTAVEATFSPDGRRVLYRSERRVLIAGTAKGAKPRTLYSGPDAFELPVFSPDSSTIALIRREEDDGDLCFARTTRRSLGALCLADDGWNLFGRPAWRRDGRVLLVPGHRQGEPRTFGLRLYQTSRPFSISPQEWSSRTATDVTTPGKGVIAGAWSPDGKRIAAITNLLSSRFEVVTAPAVDLELVEPKSTKVAACDFAWRPDGKELVVVEGDATCSQRTGKVKRVTLARPTKPTNVADEGRNPSYQPLRR